MDQKILDFIQLDGCNTAEERALHLANPVTGVAKRIEAFFRDQKDVSTVYDYNTEDGTGLLRIYVGGATSAAASIKADLIDSIIKHTPYKVGSARLDVEVYALASDGATPASRTTIVEKDARDLTSEDIATMGADHFLEMWHDAMIGNPNGVMTMSIFAEIYQAWYHFLEFYAKPLVYQADDISNPRGYRTVLPEEIVKECFVTNGILVSTYVGAKDRL